MVIMVPLVLVLFTLSTRHLSHPLFHRLLPGSSPITITRVNVAAEVDRSEYQAHPPPQRRQNGASDIPVGVPSYSSTPSGIVFPSLTATTTFSITPTSTQNATQTFPTIPTSPPVLPTPFPQAFDTTLANNFTTTSCETFLTNMTQSAPFRQCRPFSFLSQTSTAFLQAQSNITALNIDIWGTCNTPVDTDQCVANMGWFTSAILVACSEEKSENNQMVLQALAGLKSYSLMRDAACLADQDTSAYCYIEAASSSNPSDLYFYSLPFGIPLPNNTIPTCSSCTKNMMALFAMQVDQIDGLKLTYTAAADLASSKCGSSYVHSQSALSSSSSSSSSSLVMPWISDKSMLWWTAGVMMCALLVELI
ncbi:hypothetical protein B0F90DRAFT_323726 [Multifurca ochricompacta]|uniref:DUF7729 domain-containing protein n=1 Tax=Multifurca ochricompacta TaxID=376703 RepID=A0AAD4M6R0_9AGAM|nr:hypothetical protein B0F90DRAFT_323726 [Multifurca ochricompacta]